MQNPAFMPYPEILREIQSLKASMRQNGKRIYELSRVLQDRVRRQEADDNTSKYLAYSTACIRFVGGFEQGFQRTSTLDRIVEAIKQEPVVQKAKEPVPKPKPVSASVGSELAVLFGQEMVDAAVR